MEKERKERLVGEDNIKHTVQGHLKVGKEVHGSRFTVHGLRFTVHGSRFTVQGSQFRV